KGKMTVLPYSYKRYVDRMFFDDVIQPVALGNRINFSIYEIDCFQWRYLRNKSFFEVFPETCRRCFREADVFIKMEHHHLTPVYILADQSVQRFKLACTCRENDIRLAFIAY